MTLDEAIIHAKEVERKNQSIADSCNYYGFDTAEKCEKCAEEHRQLAEWLIELKTYRKAWRNLQKEINKLNPDKNSFSIKNNACMLVAQYKPKENEENKSCDNCKWNKTEKCQPFTCTAIGYDGYGLWNKAESEEEL